MLSYELCKRLKDAGFPQNRKPLNCSCGNYVFTSKSVYENINGSELVAQPTLFELIEACGKESVIILTYGKAMSTALHGVTGTYSRGETPEEAVAELWISLARKKE